MEKPRTIHDFGGFPQGALRAAVSRAGLTGARAADRGNRGATRVDPDSSWGLDHGAWSVLIRMFPAADIPVVQLSLDRTQPPACHYALGQALKPLRNRGVLIVGSGNVVHNLWAALVG